jgi:hypothetical protein
MRLLQEVSVGNPKPFKANVGEGFPEFEEDEDEEEIRYAGVCYKPSLTARVHWRGAAAANLSITINCCCCCSLKFFCLSTMH